MKTSKLLLISLFLTLVLVACGGGGTSDAPVDVVKSVVKAMEDLDVDAASKHFCDARKAELDDTLASGFEELEALGMDPDELLEAIKLEMKDMSYEEKSKDGDKAVVGVSGTLSLGFDTEKLRSLLKQVAEAAGQTVTDEELDLVVGMFGAMAGQEAPFEGEVELIKEDGDWVVCDDIDFLNEIDLGF
jgi:hypothetical protein